MEDFEIKKVEKDTEQEAFRLLVSLKVRTNLNFTE